MSYSFTMVVLLITCGLNAVGDVFLLRGVRYNDWQPGIKALIKTSDRDLIWGSLSGFTTITFWFLLLPFLAKLEGIGGVLTTLTYAAYVSVTMTFHVAYGFIGLAVKADNSLESKFNPLASIIKLTSFGFASLFSLFWGFMAINMGVSWLYFLFSPVITILFFQIVLGRLLQKVPYYLVISGSLAMLTFFAGFIHFAANQLGS